MTKKIPMFLVVFLVIFAIVTLISGLVLEENAGGLAYGSFEAVEIEYNLVQRNIGGQAAHMPFGELANFGFSAGMGGFVATLFVMSFIAYKASNK